MKSTKGFSLIELMMVIAIVGVLAAIAIPSYNDSVKKSHRAEGKAMLLEVAQLQERFYTENGHYGTFADLSITGNALNSENGYYALTMPGFVADPGLRYTLEVTPQGGHSDPECAILSLASTGEKGTRAGTADREYCW